MTGSGPSTRDRIYDAAVVEFAAKGLDGTTIDSIARRAAVNRERVYSYFVDKRSLFFEVTSGELGKLADSVSLVVDGPSDVGRFAGDAFDYQIDHPALARLVLWEGLVDDGGAEQDRVTRARLYSAKAEAIASAQARGVISDEIEPAAFAFVIISVASYWHAAPQLARMLVPDIGEASVLGRRLAVVTAAERLATPLRHP